MRKLKLKQVKGLDYGLVKDEIRIRTQITVSQGTKPYKPRAQSQNPMRRRLCPTSESGIPVLWTLLGMEGLCSTR